MAVKVSENGKVICCNSFGMHFDDRMMMMSEVDECKNKTDAAQSRVISSSALTHGIERRPAEDK